MNESIRQYLLRPHYSNCTMYSLDGIEMCRLSERRANWYLSRNLANVISKDPFKIQINFVPSGTDCLSDPYYLEEKFNRCVCCGTTEQLTRHHCVPFCFRKHFPMEYKENTNHDVLLVCTDCHDSYERIAQPIKKAMLNAAGVKMGKGSRIGAYRMAQRAAATLCNHAGKIPEDKEKMLREQIEAFFGKPVSDETILKLYLNKTVDDYPIARDFDPWKMVVDNLPDLPLFIRLWRKHFLDIMQPIYMPNNWCIEGRYKKPQSNVYGENITSCMKP